MSCDHVNLNVRTMKVGKTPNGFEMTIADISCRDCGESLSLADRTVDPVQNGFRVRLRVDGFDASTLRCPRCDRRLFGREGEPGARLDASPILDVECGQPHIVVCENATLAVSDGVVTFA